jgi:hypothetical protein
LSPLFTISLFCAPSFHLILSQCFWQPKSPNCALYMRPSLGPWGSPPPWSSLVYTLIGFSTRPSHDRFFCFLMYGGLTMYLVCSDWCRLRNCQEQRGYLHYGCAQTRLCDEGYYPCDFRWCAWCLRFDYCCDSCRKSYVDHHIITKPTHFDGDMCVHARGGSPK